MTSNWDGRIRADARQLPIASESVQCVVTSPPYWGLRDYGNPGQIGLEATPREYINSIREVALELWRVLKPDGTLWLNLGDSYCSTAPGTMGDRSHIHAISSGAAEARRNFRAQTPHGLKPKDLVGIPWRVAFALQEDGWYLRRDIIWAKPNPMPESVTDRPTSSHEYIFLLTKSARYHYDASAIREPFADERNGNPGAYQSSYANGPDGKGVRGSGGNKGDVQEGRGWNRGEELGGRNKRSVWTISTRPYPEAHYATFPEEIPEICIKAGTKPGDLVLDPFFGSGTVGRVAERLSRRWIGCDLSYQDLQKKRVTNVQKELTEVL